ncbi:MAG: hypothetical protein R2873_28810 [Caldilineaceae bacterium]
MISYTLFWQPLTLITTNYHGFIHLVDIDGAPLAQKDQLAGSLTPAPALGSLQPGRGSLQATHPHRCAQRPLLAALRPLRFQNAGTPARLRQRQHTPTQRAGTAADKSCGSGAGPHAHASADHPDR